MTASTNFKRMQGRTPVDALARRVTGKGEQFEEAALHESESATAIPVWKFFGRRCDDLTGRRQGLLTVVGCAAVEAHYQQGAAPKRPSRSGTLWVVRCVCGVYGRRRTKSLKKPGPSGCSRCLRKHIEGTRPA